MELYGLVRWINDHPILDGMDCYSSKDSAMKKLMSSPIMPGVKYTLIRINISKADILSKAKELIDVSDEEIDYLIEMLDAFDNNFEIESKRKRFKRNHIRNFISSLCEEKK